MSIDAALDRILLDILSDRIIERMRGGRHAGARKALVLFSGTDLGREAALGQLQQLHCAGWHFETVTAPDAPPLPGDRLAKFGAVEASGEPGVLADNHSVILIPALSLTLAAKVALGIADDPLSAAVQRGLERDARIVAARDGVCPGNRDRRARRQLPSSAYQAMMSDYLGRLVDFGIEMTWAARLAVATDAGAAPVLPVVTKTACARTEGVFGLREARSLESPELRLGHAVIVTPAAAEELSARDIAVVRE